MTSYIQAVEEQQDKDRLWKSAVLELLRDLMAYMDKRADVVDGDYGEPVANKELVFYDRIKKLLGE
jgi:hypothetical protein